MWPGIANRFPTPDLDSRHTNSEALQGIRNLGRSYIEPNEAIASVNFLKSCQKTFCKAKSNHMSLCDCFKKSSTAAALRCNHQPRLKKGKTWPTKDIFSKAVGRMLGPWAQREGGRGVQFPRRRKFPTMQQVFFSTAHLLPKDLRFKHGSAELASCPARRLTSLHTWLGLHKLHLTAYLKGDIILTYGIRLGKNLTLTTAMVIYAILNLECCKCARMRLHCTIGLVVLRICAPWRER